VEGEGLDRRARVKEGRARVMEEQEEQEEQEEEKKGEW
jgi:hypothetical protein